jgi:excisionase family DNA binding protein
MTTEETNEFRTEVDGGTSTEPELSGGMTVTEFSEESGYSLQTTRRWIRTGFIKAYRRGLRGYEIPRSELARIRRPVNPEGDAA